MWCIPRIGMLNWHPGLCIIYCGNMRFKSEPIHINLSYVVFTAILHVCEGSGMIANCESNTFEKIQEINCILCKVDLGNLLQFLRDKSLWVSVRLLRISTVHMSLRNDPNSTVYHIHCKSTLKAEESVERAKDMVKNENCKYMLSSISVRIHFHFLFGDLGDYQFNSHNCKDV